ncbi:hypothetical protein P6C68_005568 [Escherichia coli]|nr:hypothetical protein [Escherichia coli]EJN3777325.1 hypothetical protein [Escherichia coli]EJN4324123.1 hypothetical protein [Escherichia coli]EJN4388318.1 hypothetical protein [Escherichia coli]EJN4422080.1 hypothetical protein [Escherichia coli]
MKIKQHKEKLEIIRNIIRETLLGNAALVVLVSMIIVLCRQEWTFISMLFTGALCLSFVFVFFWFIEIIQVYINELTESKRIKWSFVLLWGGIEGTLVYNVIRLFPELLRIT